MPPRVRRRDDYRGAARAGGAGAAAAAWTVCHPDVALTEGGTLATNIRGLDGYRSAVSGDVRLFGAEPRGRHSYAEFTVVENRALGIMVGVVPVAAAGRTPPLEMDTPWFRHPDAHMWGVGGSHWQGNGLSGWQGAAGYSEGDTVGLELDVNGGTLTAFKNGARLGVLVPNVGAPSLGAGPCNVGTS
jgi:hypothetical protein